MKLHVLLFGLIVGAAFHASAADAPKRPLGMEALAHPEYLPFFYPRGTQTLQFSSHDPTGDNDDGNFQRAFVKYIDANGEYVMFDAYGPGCLCRQQFNTRWVYDERTKKLVLAGAQNSRVRYYFDGERTPRIDMTVGDFFEGKNPSFGAPFAFTSDFKDYKGGDGFVDKTRPAPTFTMQYYPLLFAKRLKVTFVPSEEFKRFLEEDKYIVSYYQYTYHLYPVDTPVFSWTRDPSSSDAARALFRNAGNDPKSSAGNKTTEATVTVAPGKTVTLLDVQGQGSIASLKLRLSPYSEETFFGVRIRMRWDEPAYNGENIIDAHVDMPIGSFFGGGSADFANRGKIPTKKLANLFYGFDGAQGTFYSYWPMPFWKSARIEIVNDSSAPVTVAAAIAQTPKEKFAYPQGDAGHFYAKQTKYSDPGDGLYAIGFHEWGLGHVVGANFFSQNYCMEGDELTFFDGSRSPQIHGNGTEDDHNQGWGGTEYQQPLWGALLNGYQGAYRIYLNDSYVFNHEINVTHETHECGGTNGKTDVVTYFYKTNPSWFALMPETDSLDVGIPESEQAHDYSVKGQTWSGSVRSAYDGYVKNPRAVTFVEEGNGQQTAEVFVDGVKVARPWLVLFNPTTPESQAWVDSEFELPAALTRGKSKLRIEVRYLDSAKADINEFHYWVYSHIPTGVSQ